MNPMKLFKRFLVVAGLVMLMLLMTGASDRPNVGGDHLDEFIIWYMLLYTFAGLATFAGALNDARRSGFFAALTIWALVVVAVTFAVQLFYSWRDFDTTGADIVMDFVALATPAFFGSLLGTIAHKSNTIPLPEALAERIRRHDEAVGEKERPPAGWRTPGSGG